MLSAHVKLEAFERSLVSAETLEQCWRAIESGARALGYSQVDARLAGERFGRTQLRTTDGAFWQMRLNLPNRDFVNITQREGASEQPVLVIPFAEVVRRILPERLEHLSPSSASLANLAAALQRNCENQSAPRNSSTRTVISSDCAAPSVNPATAS